LTGQGKSKIALRTTFDDEDISQIDSSIDQMDPMMMVKAKSFKTPAMDNFDEAELVSMPIPTPAAH
jgi:hypothetical protein